MIIFPVTRPMTQPKIILMTIVLGNMRQVCLSLGIVILLLPISNNRFEVCVFCIFLGGGYTKKRRRCDQKVRVLKNIKIKGTKKRMLNIC